MLPSLSSLTMACAALAAVLALIWVTQRAVRLGGLGRSRAGARLALIEAMALDPRRKLQLIRCDDRAVLLLTGGTQDIVVGWLAREETPS